jgi:hypothetical protein
MVIRNQTGKKVPLGTTLKSTEKKVLNPNPNLTISLSQQGWKGLTISHVHNWAILSRPCSHLGEWTLGRGVGKLHVNKWLFWSNKVCLLLLQRENYQYPFVECRTTDARGIIFTAWVSRIYLYNLLKNQNKKSL